MNRKILIGCYEVPGFGGASSVAYGIFEKIQSEGYNVYFFNLINELDLEYFQFLYREDYGNPKRLKNVYNVILSGGIFKKHDDLITQISVLDPDILIGVGYIAANILNRAYSLGKLIFITTGCTQVKRYLERDSNITSTILESKFDHEELLPAINNKQEQQSVNSAELIVTHSDIINKFYNYFYPSSRGKIYSNISWFNEYICDEAKDYIKYSKVFSDREIDILFIASMWDRVEKNYPLLLEIVSSCKDLNIHVVGEYKRGIKNVNYHGLIVEKDKLFKLLGDTKTVVCTSSFDSAPGVLFEASVMGCNLIASKNCGNWMICNDELLVCNYDYKEFGEKIYRSIDRKFEDNLNYFNEKSSYKELLNTISLI